MKLIDLIPELLSAKKTARVWSRHSRWFPRTRSTRNALPSTMWRRMVRSAPECETCHGPLPYNGGLRRFCCRGCRKLRRGLNSRAARKFLRRKPAA